MKNRDEPIQVNILENIRRRLPVSLCSCLKQTTMSFFFFSKSENRRKGQVLPGGWGVVPCERKGYGERV
jgi:hypothetical protein